VARVKRDTDDDGAIRAHQQGMKTGHRYPLWNVNTNESDLNGLTYKLNSDDAMKSRLSIQWWRKQSKTPEENREIAHRYLDNPNMGYSLYRYLFEELDISDYDCGRYANAQKDQIITELLARNKSPLQEFVESLMYANEAPETGHAADEPNLYLIKTYKPTVQSGATGYEYIITTEFAAEFTKFAHCRINTETLKKELKTLGWDTPSGGNKKISGKSVRCYTRDLQTRTTDDDAVPEGNDCGL
jgi:hypothetical protein